MIIKKAVGILRSGGLVAFPTETVYGLGADARNEQAILKIFAVKNRPKQNPLIVHIRSTDELYEWAAEIPPEAYQLAERFWPGPLTLILKKAKHVLACLTGGQDTVALRMPQHPIAQSLLQSFNGGIAGPSANRYTHVSPTQACHVREELGQKVDLILDGGACEVGLESTIVNLSGSEPEILRPGCITSKELEEVLGQPIKVVGKENGTLAPGMHQLHYAPRTKTILFQSHEMEAVLQNLTQEKLPVAVVTHNKTFNDTANIDFIKLSADPLFYARELYQTLRWLDRKGYKTIFIENVSTDVAWEAIRDRLVKASGMMQSLQEKN